MFQPAPWAVLALVSFLASALAGAQPRPAARERQVVSNRQLFLPTNATGPELLPHARASPLFQHAPGCHPRQAELLARQHLPRNPAPQDEDDGLQRRTVIGPRSARLLLGPGRRQQRRHALPEGIGNELADHAPQGGHGLPRRPAQPLLSLGAVKEALAPSV